MKKTCLSFICSLLFTTAVFAAEAADVTLVKQGNALYSSGKVEEALVFYKKAMEKNPSNFFAVMNTGYAYAAMGDNKTALVYLEKAYAMNPEEDLKKGIARLKRLEEKDFFTPDNPLKFSKKIGFNASTIAGGTSSYNLKSGLATGFDTIYGFGGLISGQAGLLYTQKGGLLSGGTGTFVMLDYIELPAAVKLSFTPIKELMTGIYGGFYGAIRVNAYTRISGVDSPAFDDYNLFDYGTVFGAEVTYPLFGLFWISADFRFTFGLGDITTDNTTQAYNSLFSAFFNVIF